MSEEKPPSLDKTMFRVSVTLTGPRGGKERFRFYLPSRSEAMTKARALLYEQAGENVVIRDPASSATWDVAKHPRDPARLQVTERKPGKKPSGYEVWLFSPHSHRDMLLSTHKRLPEAEKAAKAFDDHDQREAKASNTKFVSRTRIKPIYS